VVEVEPVVSFQVSNYRKSDWENNVRYYASVCMGFGFRLWEAEEGKHVTVQAVVAVKQCSFRKDFTYTFF
jgi:hypothetical protein